MDAGTLSMRIEDRDRGVIFKDLNGFEVWPAVCFYSSGRTIEILRMEGPLGSSTGPASATTVPLDEVPMEAAEVGYGRLGKKGDLGYVVWGNGVV